MTELTKIAQCDRNSLFNVDQLKQIAAVCGIFPISLLRSIELVTWWSEYSITLMKFDYLSDPRFS